MLRAKTILTELFDTADVHFDGARAWNIRVKDERLYVRRFAAGRLGFGEASIDGWRERAVIDGMIGRLWRAGVPRHVRNHRRAALAWATFDVRYLQTRRRSRIVGRRHYDLGNNFFAARLNSARQHSCAWFHDTADLAGAQVRKLDLIGRKLDPHSGRRLLDIGCGWGGLARDAARHHGCRVVGVGMLEHVGFRNHRRYMQAVPHYLHADGDIFLCHTIGSTTSRRWSDPWITRCIFPNSMLPSPAQVTRAAEESFILEDAENLGAHYDRTLLAWEANVRRTWPRFRAHYGDRFLRMWRYDLLAWAGAFRARAIELYQFVFAKGGVPGGYAPVRAWRDETSFHLNPNVDLLIAP